MGFWIPEKQNHEPEDLVILEENERRHILRDLNSANWLVSSEKRAAKILGMKRTTLQARIKKLGFERPE